MGNMAAAQIELVGQRSDIINRNNMKMQSKVLHKQFRIIPPM